MQRAREFRVGSHAPRTQTRSSKLEACERGLNLNLNSKLRRRGVVQGGRCAGQLSLGLSDSRAGRLEGPLSVDSCGSQIILQASTRAEILVGVDESHSEGTPGEQRRVLACTDPDVLRRTETDRG
eukprot:3371164-Rhodomonas_salina.2